MILMRCFRCLAQELPEAVQYLKNPPLHFSACKSNLICVIFLRFAFHLASVRWIVETLLQGRIYSVEGTRISTDFRLVLILLCRSDFLITIPFCVTLQLVIMPVLFAVNIHYIIRPN
jgi:hypothetical protein